MLYHFSTRLFITSIFFLAYISLPAASTSKDALEKHIAGTFNAGSEVCMLNEALINRIGWQEREVQSAKRAVDCVFIDDMQSVHMGRGQKCSNKDGSVTVVIDNDFLELLVTQPQPGTTLAGYAPSFSPDGKKLAYILGRSILIVPVEKLLHADRAENTLKIKIPKDNWCATHLSWSPDSTFIMYKTKDGFENDGLPDRFAIWNARTGEECFHRHSSREQLHFGKNAHELVEVGFSKENNWMLHKDYTRLLHLFSALDQLSESSENYTELSQQYPGCINRQFLPFLLTAYQIGWQHRKPHVLVTEHDLTCWAALCKVSHYMQNQKLFRPANAVEKIMYRCQNYFK